PEQIDQIRADVTAAGPRANRAKRQVARAVVALYHGEPAALRAEERFDEVFRARQIPQDVPEFAAPAGDPLHVPALIVAMGAARSSSEARRLIASGAVRRDGAAVGGYDAGRDAVVGRVLSVGKRHHVRVIS